MIGALLVSLIGGICGYLIVLGGGSAFSSSSKLSIGMSVSIFLTMYSLVSEMIRSGVNSSIICFCEEPMGVKGSHPELYEKYSQIVSHV